MSDTSDDFQNDVQQGRGKRWQEAEACRALIDEKIRAGCSFAGSASMWRAWAKSHMDDAYLARAAAAQLTEISSPCVLTAWHDARRDMTAHVAFARAYRRVMWLKHRTEQPVSL
jgi:hypothetical protein